MALDQKESARERYAKGFFSLVFPIVTPLLYFYNRKNNTFAERQAADPAQSASLALQLIFGTGMLLLAWQYPVANVLGLSAPLYTSLFTIGAWATMVAIRAVANYFVAANEKIGIWTGLSPFSKFQLLVIGRRPSVTNELVKEPGLTSAGEIRHKEERGEDEQEEDRETIDQEDDEPDVLIIPVQIGGTKININILHDMAPEKGQAEEILRNALLEQSVDFASKAAAGVADHAGVFNAMGEYTKFLLNTADENDTVRLHDSSVDRQVKPRLVTYKSNSMESQALKKSISNIESAVGNQLLDVITRQIAAAKSRTKNPLGARLLNVVNQKVQDAQVRLDEGNAGSLKLVESVYGQWTALALALALPPEKSGVLDAKADVPSNPVEGVAKDDQRAMGGIQSIIEFNARVTALNSEIANYNQQPLGEKRYKYLVEEASALKIARESTRDHKELNEYLQYLGFDEKLETAFEKLSELRPRSPSPTSVKETKEQQDRPFAVDVNAESSSVKTADLSPTHATRGPVENKHDERRRSSCAEIISGVGPHVGERVQVVPQGFDIPDSDSGPLGGIARKDSVSSQGSVASSTLTTPPATPPTPSTPLSSGRGSPVDMDENPLSLLPPDVSGEQANAVNTTPKSEPAKTVDQAAEETEVVEDGFHPTNSR